MRRSLGIIRGAFALRSRARAFLRHLVFLIFGLLKKNSSILNGVNKSTRKRGLEVVRSPEIRLLENG
jgi:hypothetical protein